MTNHQREGAASNAAVGEEFERRVQTLLLPRFPRLTRSFALPVGHLRQKQHRFDLGCREDRVIVECKSHTWTAGGNTPSAKMTTWDKEMLYFYLAPRSYRKLFVVKRDVHPRRGLSLAEHYVRTHEHLIPDEVEFWELDEAADALARVPFDAVGHLTH